MGQLRFRLGGGAGRLERTRDVTRWPALGGHGQNDLPTMPSLTLARHPPFG
jgi:hypothetical protein